MASSIKQLSEPLDKAAVLADVYTLLGLFGLTTTALQPGTPVGTVLSAVVAWIVDQLWNPFVVPALRAPFLDYSAGDWLTIVAWAIYNRPRILAQRGTTTIDVENRSNSSGVVSIPVGSIRVRNGTTGATYTNTTAATVAQWAGSGAYPLASPRMTFESDQAGAASSAIPGAILPYPAPPVTSPSVGLYALTNGAAIVGSDDEPDANTIARCRAAVGDISAGGPRLAYVSAALDPVGAFTRRSLPVPPGWGPSAPAISRIRILEPAGSRLWAPTQGYLAGVIRANLGSLYICTTPGTSAGSGGPSGVGTGIVDNTVRWSFIGQVYVVLASASGPAAGDNATSGTDVFKANVAIQMFIVTPGITAVVAPAVAHTVALGNVVVDIAAESLVTQADAVATATAALAEFNRTITIGGARGSASGVVGFVFYDKLAALFAGAPGAVNVRFSSLAAGTDTFIDPNEVPIVTAASITANIVTQGA